MKRVWGVECPHCLKRMFSFHVHDFKYCGCDAETFVDGGTDYLRYGGGRGRRPRLIYWSKKDGKYPVNNIKDRFPR